MTFIDLPKLILKCSCIGGSDHRVWNPLLHIQHWQTMVVPTWPSLLEEALNGVFQLVNIEVKVHQVCQHVFSSINDTKFVLGIYFLYHFVDMRNSIELNSLLHSQVLQPSKKFDYTISHCVLFFFYQTFILRYSNLICLTTISNIQQACARMRQCLDRGGRLRSSCSSYELGCDEFKGSYQFQFLYIILAYFVILNNHVVFISYF